MRKFWLSGVVDTNSLKMETKEETVEYDSGGGGGIVNDAFADDEFDMTYTRWKDLGVIKELEENITGVRTNKDVDIKKNVESRDSGHDSCSKHYSVTDSEDTATDTASATDTYSELEVDLMRRPSRSVSRLIMIQKLSDEQGKLGTMCQEDNCPYNQWLYRGHNFPEDKTVKDWEMKDKAKEKAEKLPLEKFCLPRVILSKHNQTRKSSPSSPSHKSHRSSSSFHYSKSPYPFAFPNPTTNIYLPTFNPPQSSGPPTPSTAPLPPYPWHLYNTPASNLSISSSYPIVTLPRSVRKSSKISTPRSGANSQSYFSKLCGEKKSLPKSPPASIFYMKPKLSVPPSPSLSSSCSCISSTCSSCNSSCIDIPRVPRDPYGFTSRRAAPRKRNPCLPRCDVTCYVITFFILMSLAGLGSLLFYLYMFTNMGHKEEDV